MTDIENMTDEQLLAELGFTPAAEAKALASFESRFKKAVSDAIHNTPTAEAAAKAVFEVVRAFAVESGQNPDVECAFRTPAQNEGFPHGKCYVVSWEAGPFQWAIGASLGGHNRLTEPHYSFDLTFYPGEWPEE